MKKAKKVDGFADLEALNNFSEAEMRLDLDRANRIDKFEKLGMNDPLNYEKSYKHSLKYMKQLNFETDVYAGL